jgi:hypothetical protein
MEQSMKNIQVIDGARNSTFDIYQISDDLFNQIFPNGTDVAFLAEVERNFKVIDSDKVWDLIYQSKVDKKQVIGIHGTLHLTGSYCSKEFFPSRKESEVVKNGFCFKDAS